MAKNGDAVRFEKTNRKHLKIYLWQYIVVLILSVLKTVERVSYILQYLDSHHEVFNI